MNRISKISVKQRKEIIELIKKHVKSEKNCRVGWAAKEIVGSEVQYHILDKISAEVIQSIRYTRDSANPNFEYDWNIRNNPFFKTTVYNLIIASISVVAAIVSVYFALRK